MVSLSLAVSSCGNLLGIDDFGFGREAGGAATGGAATGGTATGGVATGGTATGGVATGGTATGGVATGGTATGGVATGGIATGGIATGGVATGGTATGGVPTGGVATGGAATGGAATGGAATGGAATGGAGLDFALDPTDATVYISTPDRSCGGGLMTNRWVITANSCVDCGRKAGDLWVQYGSQVVSVRELVRYPDGDCSAGLPAESHDIMLLGLAEPMNIDGSAYGYRRNYWPMSTDLAKSDGTLTLWCRGWFMTPAGVPGKPQLRLFEPSSWFVAQDINYLSHNIGDLIWLGNSEPTAPLTGRIFTPPDIGSGCWVTDGTWRFYAGVYTPAAPQTRGLGLNANEEVRVTSVSNVATRQFLESSLFSVTDWSNFTSGSAIVPVAVSREATDYLWVDDTGHLVVRHRRADQMADIVDLGAPEGRTLLVEKPGVLHDESNNNSVWARDSDNKLWTRRQSADTWQNWAPIELGPLASSVTPTLVETVINLISRDANGIGIFATLDDSLNVLSSWQNLPGDVPMTSPFTAGIHRLYARASDGCILHYWLDYSAAWTGGNAEWTCDVHGEPAAVGYQDGNTVDLFYRNGLGHLAHTWMEYFPTIDAVPYDTGIRLPGTTLAATSSGHGSLEVVAREGNVLHVVRYPRE